MLTTNEQGKRELEVSEISTLALALALAFPTEAIRYCPPVYVVLDCWKR
jgi:hypothetical protein